LLLIFFQVQIIACWLRKKAKLILGGKPTTISSATIATRHTKKPRN